jgi:hypothetical protein
MSPERVDIIRAVISGRLSEDYITPTELVEVGETVMDMICLKKMEEGFSVFSHVEHGRLN